MDEHKQAVADADKILRKAGLKTYTDAVEAIQHAVRLGNEGARVGQVIRDAMTEVLERFSKG